MPSPSTNNSTHPDFPNNTEVVNTSLRSHYYGQRGVVCGSGPSKRSTSTHAVVYVRWPSGDRFKYFPNSLAIAPKKESEYRVSHRTQGKRKVQVHEVPATVRPCPSIFQRLAASRSQTANNASEVVS